MKSKSSLVLLFLLLAATANCYAQERVSAAETVEKLKFELFEVQGQEEYLRMRKHELEESIKPENIERSLAGVGSTKPEELRDFRRRQLEIEKNAVSAQLKVLENSRQRLETAIANAEALAYQESAGSITGNQMRAKSSRPGYLLLLGGGGLAALALGGSAVLYRRRKKQR
jgi:hypothetical protein